MGVSVVRSNRPSERGWSIGALLLVALLYVGCGPSEQASTDGGAGGETSTAAVGRVESASGVDAPDVVLITVGALRADRLPIYGHDGVATPHLSRFAARSVVFDRAYTTAPSTLPAIASVMTGTYPAQHGIHTVVDSLPDAADTLAERLAARGFRTFAYVSHHLLDRRFGLAQGFESYDDRVELSLIAGIAGDPPDPTLFERGERWRYLHAIRRERSQGYRPNAALADVVTVRLREETRSPIFLWLHLFGVDEAERPPKLAEDRALLESQGDPPDAVASAARFAAGYDASIEALDHQLGRIFDALERRPRWDETVVVLHADHGHALDDRARSGHHYELSESNTRIPLLLRLPRDHRAGEHVERSVSLVDLVPTLLALAGAEMPAALPGSHLLEERTSERPIFLESYEAMATTQRRVSVAGVPTTVGSALVGVVVGPWKLVESGWRETTAAHGYRRVRAADPPLVERRFLYDVVGDAFESQNRLDEQPDRVAPLEQVLSTYDS
jgi:arylsulfatase A-like enzyme